MNRQQLSMVCTLANHRKDIKMFKTQVEHQGSHCHVLNILTTFPWSVRA